MKRKTSMILFGFGLIVVLGLNVFKLLWPLYFGESQQGTKFASMETLLESLPYFFIAIVLGAGVGLYRHLRYESKNKRD